MRRLAIAMMLVVGSTLLSGCAEFHKADTQDTVSGEADELRQMHLAMIRGLIDQGKDEAALAFLDDYEMRFPNDREARAMRGEALLRVGKLKEAEALFQTMLKSNDRPEADFGLGQVSAGSGDWNTAATHFYDAARLAPTNARYLNNYGYALLEVGRAKDAYDVLSRAYELTPGDNRTRNNYVLAAERSGHDVAVTKALQTASAADRADIMNFVQGWTP